jgi:1-acyl-sn-glycerol-3-phosphate acyltransferase
MLRNLFCIFTAFMALLLLFPAACLAMLLTWNASSAIWVARKWWSPVQIWAGGGELHVEGLEHVDPNRPTIYASNHQSTIDIPVLFCALPVDLRFIAKKQLGYVPMLGWYLKIGGHILIDRKNHRRAMASLEQAAREIRSGKNIIVFPEGTRSEDGRVLPFKKGPFTLALKAGVPVCPVTIEGSGKLMPKSSWRITPGPIRVRIGAPIATRDVAERDRDAFVKRVRDVIIDQSLAMGGQGGDRDDPIAAAGKEGVGRRALAKGAVS